MSKLFLKLKGSSEPNGGTIYSVYVLITDICGLYESEGTYVLMFKGKPDRFFMEKNCAASFLHSYSNDLTNNQIRLD